MLHVHPVEHLLVHLLVLLQQLELQQLADHGQLPVAQPVRALAHHAPQHRALPVMERLRVRVLEHVQHLVEVHRERRTRRTTPVMYRALQ